MNEIFGPWQEVYGKFGGTPRWRRFLIDNDRRYIGVNFHETKPNTKKKYCCLACFDFDMNKQIWHDTLEDAQHFIDMYIVEHNNATLLTQEQYDKLILLI